MRNVIAYTIPIFAFMIAVLASAQDIVIQDADNIWRWTPQAPTDVKPIEARVIVNYANSIYHNTFNALPEQLRATVSQVGSKFTINDANTTYWRTLIPMNPAIVDFTAEGEGIGVNLTWVNQRASEFPETLIVYSLSDIKWRPDDGTDYRIGDEVVGGAIVGFLGGGSSTTIQGLSPNTLYYFAAFAYDRGRGEYSIGSYISAVIPSSPGIKGDVNGDGKVRSNDAILALRASVGMITLTDEQFWAADVNGDGRVRANDAILILRKSAGLTAPSIGAVASRRKQTTITVDEVYGVVSEEIAVPLRANNFDMIAGGDVCIVYDPALLRAVGVSSTPGVLLASNTSKPGAVHIAFACAEGLSDAELTEIQFEILASGVSSLRFENAELYRPDASRIDVMKSNGRFISWESAPQYKALHQSFPNPFNPDTWIPYQLDEDANVVIRVHNISGQLVRTLVLGRKSAGFYTSRDEAAYWNGQNEAGEQVASGVYFYTIQAGDFTATKKMLVAK